MSDNNYYVEPNHNGGFSVFHDGEEILHTDTQREAIESLKKIAPNVKPHIGRVRETGHGHRGQFRKS